MKIRNNEKLYLKKEKRTDGWGIELISEDSLPYHANRISEKNYHVFEITEMEEVDLLFDVIRKEQ